MAKNNKILILFILIDYLLKRTDEVIIFASLFSIHYLKFLHIVYATLHNVKQYNN